MSLRGAFNDALCAYYAAEAEQGPIAIVVAPGASIRLSRAHHTFQAVCLLGGERVGVLSDTELPHLLDRCVGRLDVARDARERLAALHPSHRAPDTEQTD